MRAWWSAIARREHCILEGQAVHTMDARKSCMTLSTLYLGILVLYYTDVMQDLYPKDPST